MLNEYKKWLDTELAARGIIYNYTHNNKQKKALLMAADGDKQSAIFDPRFLRSYHKHFQLSTIEIDFTSML
jgi:hypothetical protein